MPSDVISGVSDVPYGWPMLIGAQGLVSIAGFDCWAVLAAAVVTDDASPGCRSPGISRGEPQFDHLEESVLGCVALLDHVRVGVEGDAHLGMAEELADPRNIDPGEQEPACERVAKCVLAEPVLPDLDGPRP